MADLRRDLMLPRLYLLTALITFINRRGAESVFPVASTAVDRARAARFAGYSTERGLGLGLRLLAGSRHAARLRAYYGRDRGLMTRPGSVYRDGETDKFVGF